MKFFSLHPYFMFVLGFWDMYDPEGYSLWFYDYKYTMMRTLFLCNAKQGWRFSLEDGSSTQVEGTMAFPWA